MIDDKFGNFECKISRHPPNCTEMKWAQDPAQYNDFLDCQPSKLQSETNKRSDSTQTAGNNISLTALGLNPNQAN